MALQDIIDTAVNVEINRSKLVAQNVSRNGRISTVSRNWNNPFRFVVTPKPIWSYDDYRQKFEPIFTSDRYLAQDMRLNQFNNSTGLATRNNSWMTVYQGQNDSANNNTLDNYVANSTSSGNKIVLTYVAGGSFTAGQYIARAGDWVRPDQSQYPYIVTDDIIAAAGTYGLSGTVTAAGVTTVPPTNSFINYQTTTTKTTITGISSTANLRVGQILFKTGGSGGFGSLTYIASIDSATQISIISDIACTAGAVTFDGNPYNTAASAVLPVHRTLVTGLTNNDLLRVGPRAAWCKVIITKLPQIRFLPGKFVEFNGDFEMIEAIQ